MDYQIPNPPMPGYHDLQFEYGSDHWLRGGVLTCHLCPPDKQKHSTDLDPPETDKAKEELRCWLTRHHVQHHPEKLYILTAAGWMQVEYLLRNQEKATSVS